MKKVISIITMLAFTHPLSAYAETTNKNTNHNVTHHQTKRQKMKDDILPAAPIVEETSNLSGLLSLTSNYMFRGISQSGNRPAVQGGITYTFPYGIYANLWGSNVHFSTSDGRLASVEFDTILGYRSGIGEDFTYDLNLARYNYPRARAANYNELNTLFNYKIIQLGLSYSANYAGTHASGTYYLINLIYPVPPEYFFNFQDFTIQAGMGHYSLAKAAGNSYNDYNVTLNKKLTSIYSITVQWTGTNGRAKVPPFDDNQILGAINANF